MRNLKCVIITFQLNIETYSKPEMINYISTNVRSDKKISTFFNILILKYIGNHPVFSLCTSACVWAWVSVSLLTWHTSAHLFMHICISLCVWVCQKEQKPGRKPRFSPSRIPNSHSFRATPSLAFSLSTPSAFLFHSSYCLDLRLWAGWILWLTTVVC